MGRRVDRLVEQDVACPHGQSYLARDLLNMLRRQELTDAAVKLSGESDLTYRSSAEGEHVSGVCRRRVILSSRRRQLFPCRPALAPRLGRLAGVMALRGNVEWMLGAQRDLGV